MRKFIWLDADLETELEDQLDTLEEDQAFLEQFYGVTMLLDAISDESDLDDEFEAEDWESVAS